MQQRKPVNQTKMKGLKSGKMYEYSFHQTENVQEAELENKPIVYIYESKGEYWFHEAGNPSKRFTLPAPVIGPAISFLKVKGEYQSVIFEEEIIGVEIPVKMQLKVTEAAPAVKGNTAQGATKLVVVETGATITTPLFINEGDIIEVNTETGEYAGRIEKS
jgi:elongation factor P